MLTTIHLLPMPTDAFAPHPRLPTLYATVAGIGLSMLTECLIGVTLLTQQAPAFVLTDAFAPPLTQFITLYAVVAVFPATMRTES